MFVVLSLLACSGCGPDPEATVPPPGVPVPAADGPLPEPRLGVSEVVTPPEVLRPTEVQDGAAPPQLDVWFDPDATTFDALRVRLVRWGFSILDGDGESWRVGVPPGRDWPARLIPLPEVARVTEVVDLVALETGAFREGSERYGNLTHTWSWRPGGPVQAVTGGRAPPEPVLPHALPAQVVRCLAPIQTEMNTGVSVGLGWERALVAAHPPANLATWAVVLESFGACDASGWILLRADAPVTTLTVGGRPVSQLDGATIHDRAVDYLRQPRPVEDASAVAALELLRTAPNDTLAAAVTEVAPGPFQKRLWEELDQRDHAAALALAGQSSSPVLRGAATAEVDALRTASLTDPNAPTGAVYAALTVWRPGPTDPPAILERLRQSPSPRVREKAWELTIDTLQSACLDRMRAVGTADVSAASAVYRECPQQPVRSAAFERVAALDPTTAGAMVNVVLEEPETLRTGVAAARNAAAIERWDLLEALVERPTVAREVRRVALELLVRASVPRADELVEQFGAYLAYTPNGVAPVIRGSAAGSATASEE